MTALPTPQDYVRAVQRQLEMVAEPLRVAPMVAYMKGQFAFLGVPTPIRRQALKALFAELGKAPSPEWLMDGAEALWGCEARECQYAAADLMVKYAKLLRPEHEPRLAKLVTSKSWWDSVDTLASGVYGPLALKHPQVLPVLDAYATSEHLWLRRVAILYPLGHKALTDTLRLQTNLDANLGHADFFIRKAIGWMLRQYARTDPDWVKAYLTSRGDRLSPLSRREAAKHLGND